MREYLPAAIGVLVALAFLIALFFLTEEQPATVNEPIKEPAAIGKPQPQTPDQEVSKRHHLPPPSGAPERVLPKTATDGEMTPSIKQDMNIAVNDRVKLMKPKCLHPWLSANKLDKAEVIFDVVVYDGEVVDYAMKSFPEPPQSVIDCVAELVWDTQWAPIHSKGTLRLQRTFEANRPRR